MSQETACRRFLSEEPSAPGVCLGQAAVHIAVLDSRQLYLHELRWQSADLSVCGCLGWFFVSFPFSSTPGWFACQGNYLMLHKKPRMSRALAQLVLVGLSGKLPALRNLEQQLLAAVSLHGRHSQCAYKKCFRYVVKPSKVLVW